MKNNLLSWHCLLGVLLLLCAQLTFAQTRNYRTSSTNFVLNSTFQGNPQAPTAPNWTFNPAGDANQGWKKENSLIYGEFIAIDRLGTHTATPALSATPCANVPKVAKFFYNEENTGPYTLNVRLGNQIIATFTNNGLAAQSNFSLGAGVSAIIDRKFLSEGTVTQNFIWNNIWHEVELYVPNYTTGTLSFEYVRNGGISRKIRIDNVELYEAIPTPVPTSSSVNLASCTATTYNLNSLLPTDTRYTYTWYTQPNPIAANLVATPTAAPVGTYYLYATPATTCANNTTATVSLPSQAVTVNGALGCCGGEVVRDGGFDATDASDSPTGYRVPAGDNANGGGTNWKRNFTDRDDVFYIGGSYVPNGNSAGTNPASIDGNTILTMKYQNLGSWRKLYQENSKICQSGTKTIKFRFAVGDQNGPLANDGYFKVFLGGPYNNNFIGNNENMPGVEIAQFYYDGNNYGTGNAIPANNMVLRSVAPNVQVRINGQTPVTGFDGNATRYPWKVWYDIEIIVPESLANTGGGIGFLGDTDVTWLMDNVSVTVGPPAAQNPSVATAAIDCTSGTYNLASATPTTVGYRYEWYTDAAGTTRVQNPAAVPVGTYYMKTISACSGCSSAALTAFTVNNTCPRISGKIFSDYDGVNTNGVSNPTNLGMSAGMFAHLVNSSSQVVNSVKVNSDGTYALNATAAGTFRVLITNTQLANNTTAPAAATLNPNYFITSASQVGNTASANITTGYSPNVTVTAGTETTGVNFGINAAPIPSNAGGDTCAVPAGTAITMPTLYGVDDDPAFNNGTGQTVYFENITQNNGVLSYNGNAVQANSSIANYQPNLLVFTPNTSNGGNVTFTYYFIDRAGQRSLENGTVVYNLLEKPEITGNMVVPVNGTITLTASITPGASPTAWTSSNPAVATVNPTTRVVTGIAVGTATITYTDYAGCSTSRDIQVVAAACTRPGVTDATATYPTLTGVTNLNKTVANQWPNIRQSGHVAIESNSAGFVLNRVATPETTITNPVEGMMVYDTTANCFKVNTTGTADGWKCLTTPTCPN